MTKTSRNRSQRGGAILEVSLSILPFLALVFATIDFSWVTYSRSVLRLAVNQGVRFGVLGRSLAGLNHDASIRKVVKDHSGGLLQGTAADSLITISYFDRQTGAATATNGPGNLISVAVSNYQVRTFGAPLWGAALNRVYSTTISASDIMTTFPGNPPVR
jgi:Flp pilus assembly protein TadG